MQPGFSSTRYFLPGAIGAASPFFTQSNVPDWHIVEKRNYSKVFCILQQCVRDWADEGPVFTFDSSERAERQPPQHKMAHDLNGKDVERAKFAFDIYDFEGKSRMDMFYLGDCLRGLNLNPTLKMIDKLGGAKKKGEKFIKVEEFYPIYSDVKKSKETGNFEDFIECLKLYDKMENGTMMLGDPEDDDGFIPYEPFLRRVCAGPHPEMYEDW